MTLEFLTYLLAREFSFFAILSIYNTISSTILELARVKRISKSGYIINNQISTPKEAKTITKEEMNEKLYEFIFPYLEKLKNYTSEENLKTLYYNLKTLKVNKSSPFAAILYLGTYSSSKNEIKCVNEEAFGHELLHTASSTYDPKTGINYCGFLQSKSEAEIGRGLNEGYTELLAARLYNKKNKITAYNKEVKIARLFEFFFDDPKEMENYYFNHNLPGFIHHMEQYAPRNEIINLMLDIDGINLHSNFIGSLLPTYNSIKTQIKLYNWYSEQCTDPVKLEQFRSIVCENKVASIILSGQELVVNRNTPIQPRVEYNHTR